MERTIKQNEINGTRIYELCFAGYYDPSGGNQKSYHYLVTQVTEITDPSLPALVLPKETNHKLGFKKAIIPGLIVGQYISAETKDGNIYTNFKRVPKPDAPLDSETILDLSVKDRARKSEQWALKYHSKRQRTLDHVISELRLSLVGMSRSERAAAAMYIYQKLME